MISTNQINERSKLPLPTVVPGVDTLTTLQLDAFLKAHPEAILIDAVVNNAHMTLPGAYWMPELGQATIGALEQHSSDRPRLLAPAKRTAKTIRPAELIQICSAPLLSRKSRVEFR